MKTKALIVIIKQMKKIKNNTWKNIIQTYDIFVMRNKKMKKQQLNQEQ